MNIVLLKGLIISGGTIGLGVPGIYYGYPYISNLVSPGAEEDKKPSEGEGQSKGGESNQVKLAQGENSETNGETTTENKKTDSLPASGERDNPPSNLGRGELGSDSSGKNVRDGLSTNGGDGGSNTKNESETSATLGNGTRDNNEQSEGVSKK